MTSMPDLPLLHALRTTPSRRYLSDRPIPTDVLWDILDTATRGPSGGNRQAWGWVVVTDPEIKRAVADWYRDHWQRTYEPRRDELSRASSSSQGFGAASFRAIEYLAGHIAEAPVWVIPALPDAAASTNPRLGASIYGAVQQLVLAARAYGIGSVLTTFYVDREPELRTLLGLPDHAVTMALLPLGYPLRGRWAEPRRLPVEQVVHWNRWGRQRERAVPSRDE
ncbi:nitroreductase family protein [Nocardia sp. NPDC049190]|uniref:nitroreductase family protein n=1 Tax=Nocardia sp. NPDC049190 TaxID=3155650 RepID=UPI0033ED3D11